MPTPFGELLQGHLEKRGWSVPSFAKRVGRSRAFLGFIVRGKTQVQKGRLSRKPPLDDLEKWADALNLEGVERQAFIDQGHLEHASEYLQARFRELQEQARRRR